MTTSNELTTTATFNDAALTSITSFADALALANAHVAEYGGVIESINDYGTGFAVLSRDQKAKLVGVPFMVLEWFQREGDFVRKDEAGEVIAEGFVSAVIVTENGQKYILNDGGTGIASQLAEVTARRREANASNPTTILAVPGGLSKSEYWRNEKSGDIARRLPDGAKKGEWEPGVTYYLT